MDPAERARIAKLAQYCPQCFAPSLIIKRNNCSKHLKNGCYVSSKRQHKFTCLNKACLKHAWICQDHNDENWPLISAHIQELQKLQTPTSNSDPTNQSLLPRPRPKTRKGRTLKTDTRKRKARSHPTASVQSDLSPTSATLPSSENSRTWHVTCKHDTSCSCAAMAASVTSLACTTIQPDAPEVRDIEGVHTGNETVDCGTPRVNHGCHNTLEEETVSRAKQDVSDAENHITNCGDSNDNQDLTSSRASSFLTKFTMLIMGLFNLR